MRSWVSPSPANLSSAKADVRLSSTLHAASWYTVVLILVSSGVSTAARAAVPTSIPTVASVPTAAKRKKDSSEGGLTKTAKKKKKRDEIDDIFGF